MMMFSTLCFLKNFWPPVMTDHSQPSTSICSAAGQMMTDVKGSQSSAKQGKPVPNHTNAHSVALLPNDSNKKLTTHNPDTSPHLHEQHILVDQLVQGHGGD